MTGCPCCNSPTCRVPGTPCTVTLDVSSLTPETDPRNSAAAETYYLRPAIYFTIRDYPTNWTLRLAECQSDRVGQQTIYGTTTYGPLQVLTRYYSDLQYANVDAWDISTGGPKKIGSFAMPMQAYVALTYGQTQRDSNCTASMSYGISPVLVNNNWPFFHAGSYYPLDRRVDRSSDKFYYLGVTAAGCDFCLGGTINTTYDISPAEVGNTFTNDFRIDGSNAFGVTWNAARTSFTVNPRNHLATVTLQTPLFPTATLTKVLVDVQCSDTLEDITYTASAATGLTRPASEAMSTWYIDAAASSGSHERWHRWEVLYCAPNLSTIQQCYGYPPHGVTCAYSSSSASSSSSSSRSSASSDSSASSSSSLGSSSSLSSDNCECRLWVVNTSTGTITDGGTFDKAGNPGYECNNYTAWQPYDELTAIAYTCGMGDFQPTWYGHVYAQIERYVDFYLPAGTLGNANAINTGFPLTNVDSSGVRPEEPTTTITADGVSYRIGLYIVNNGFSYVLSIVNLSTYQTWTSPELSQYGGNPTGGSTVEFTVGAGGIVRLR